VVANVQSVENGRRVLARHLGVDQHTEATGVHRGELAQVIHVRVDRDPEIALFVVLSRSDQAGSQAKTQSTCLGHLIGSQRSERLGGGLLLRRHRANSLCGRCGCSCR
jgi:hypothetical protein